MNQNILDRSTHVKEILEYSILPKLLDNKEEFDELVDNPDAAFQKIVTYIKDSFKMDMLKSIFKANSATVFEIVADIFIFSEGNLIEYILKYDADNILFGAIGERFINRLFLDALFFHEAKLLAGKYKPDPFCHAFSDYEDVEHGIPSLSDIARFKSCVDQNVPWKNIEIIEDKDNDFVRRIINGVLIPQYAFHYDRPEIFSHCILFADAGYGFNLSEFCATSPKTLKHFLFVKSPNNGSIDLKKDIEEGVLKCSMFCELKHKESFLLIAAFYLKHYLIEVFLDLTLRLKNEAYFTLWKHVFRLPEFNVALEKQQFCMDKTIKSLINTAEHIISRSDSELASIHNVASKLREIYRRLKTDPLNERNNCSKFIKETDKVNKESGVSKCAEICEQEDNKMESLIEDKNNHPDDCDIDTLETETRIEKVKRQLKSFQSNYLNAIAITVMIQAYELFMLLEFNRILPWLIWLNILPLF
ncbi:hypothetical protein ROZALSC1DRAFT_27677, partial [Rozella allomycis CSF55]